MADITRARTFAVIDEFGVDPLRDKSFEAIRGVTSFQYYTVKAGEQFNLPLIAYNAYLNEEYWRVIQIYNDIADMFAVKEGMRLKIPNLALVVSALNGILSEQPAGNRIVSI